MEGEVAQRERAGALAPARSIAVTTVIAALICALRASAGPPPPPTFPACERPAKGVGDCFEVTPAAGGCEDPKCCNEVCAIDRTCCTDFWGLDCATAAEKMCEPPPLCPGKGDCFVVHEEPSCTDLACCELQCRLDWVCCIVMWDPLCVQQAEQLCGIAPCTVQQPVGATLEPEECGERLNDGCNLDTPAATPIVCGQTYFGQTFAAPPRDTDWYQVIVENPRTLTWTVTSEFPASIMILASTCDPAINILASSFTDSCHATSLSYCAQPGTYRLFVAPGMSTGPLYFDLACADWKVEVPPYYGNHYTAKLTCTGCGPAGPADLNGDGLVNGLDLAILLGQWSGPATYPACPPFKPADLSHDCRVNGLDLAILLASWAP